LSIEPVPESPQLFDLVYQRIIASIVDTSLVPGQRIVQADLAAGLGVSRAPVSHALQVLKHQGLVRESGRKGLEVAPIDPERVGNLYQIRVALEGLAARMAAQKMRNGALPAADVAALRAAFNAGNRLGNTDPMSQRVQADIEFHRTIYRISGNASIGEIMEPLWPHMQRAMVLVLEANRLRQQAWREHRQVMDSILAGDSQASFEAACAHAGVAGDYVTDRLRATTPAGRQHAAQ
jgi:DNA-binding GntR family transcriptional regulator